MKALRYVLMLIVVTVSVSVKAEYVYKDSSNQVYIMEGSLLTSNELHAYNNPGKIVRLFKDPVFKRVGFAHYITISESNDALVYDGKNIRSISENLVTKSDQKFLFPIVFILFGLVVMFVSNLFYRKRHISSTAVSVIAVMATVLTAATSTTLTAVLATIASVAGIVVVVVDVISGSKKYYLIFLCAFYMFSIMGMIVGL